MSSMATPISYTDATGIQWVVHTAFLEITGDRDNVLLLVSDTTGLVRRVVYQNKFANGMWRLVHVSSYSLEFHCDGVPQHFHLDRQSDTSVWMRRDDSRYFIEARDAAAMIDAYPPTTSSRYCLPSNVVGDSYTDVAGIQWQIHKAFVEICGDFRNVLLLICDPEKSTRRVVFGNKFVNGQWEIVHKDHYHIKFNCKGVDADAAWLDYNRQAGTSVWMRFRDKRAFVEPRDMHAMMAGYMPREPA
jgi:hypothetical protein